MTPRKTKTKTIRNRPGVGECGTPDCGEERAPGRFLCSAHADEMDRIRKELTEDPLLLYNQRSDIRDTTKRKRAPRVPTCCYVGCFEIRVPPSPYCDIHRDHGTDD